MPFRILSTKELPDSLLATAAEQGIDIIIGTFIHIQPVSITTTLPPANSTVIFTSANAVNASPLAWKVYCLNGATLEAVTERLPHAQVMATASNATALAQLIIRDDVRSATFFCGNIRRNELPDLLLQNGITLQEIIAYETTEVPTVTTNNYDGIFFFSPSGVKSYFTVNTPPASAICFAIGNTTANTLKTYTTNRIIISPDAPSAEQMVQTAISYFKNIN